MDSFEEDLEIKDEIDREIKEEERNREERKYTNPNSKEVDPNSYNGTEARNRKSKLSDNISILDLSSEERNTKIINDLYDKLISFFFDTKGIIIQWKIIIWCFIIFIALPFSNLDMKLFTDCKSMIIFHAIVKEFVYILLYIAVILLAIFPSMKNIKKIITSILSSLITKK